LSPKETMRDITQQVAVHYDAPPEGGGEKKREAYIQKHEKSNHSVLINVEPPAWVGEKEKKRKGEKEKKGHRLRSALHRPVTLASPALFEEEKGATKEGMKKRKKGKGKERTGLSKTPKDLPPKKEKKRGSEAYASMTLLLTQAAHTRSTHRKEKKPN